MILENNLSLKKVISATILFVIIVLVIVVLFPLFKKNSGSNASDMVVISEPKRTDYKGTLPPLFPADVILPASDKLSQSYAKDYGTLKQSSAVLFSLEDVKSNVLLYKEAFLKAGYTISTSTESVNSSILVMNKMDSRVEVTFINRINSGKHSSTTTPSGIKTHIIINTFKK